MDKVMSNKKVIALYIAPALFLVLALIYVPIVQTGYFGMTKWNGVGAKEFIGLENYMALIKDEMFWKNSIPFSYARCIFSNKSDWLSIYFHHFSR
ncbi:hypothetical protein GCM10020331_080030 [Ectobacillus funiculus]